MPPVSLRSRRLQLLGALALSSGMPLGFVWVTLQFFLVDLSIPKATIGLLSGVSLPWTVKFLWSPLVDRYALAWPGRRRSWVLVTQLLLALAFGGFALVAYRILAVPPAGRAPSTPLLIGLMAMVIAFLSATQDIAYDAYCVEALEPAEQGPVSGLKILYYRVGMLLAGAFAVSASDFLPWPLLFGAIGGLFVLMTGLTLLAEEPRRPSRPPRSLVSAVVEPVRTYFRRDNAVVLALFMVFYKFGDSMGGTMVNPFFKDLCFTNAEAGAALKTVGTLATIAGAALGAYGMTRVGLGRALWIFGLLQALANLLYSGTAFSRGVPLDVHACASLPAISGLTRTWAYAAIAGEYGAQGLASAAQGALLLRICDKRYSATQFALLSSLFGLGRWGAGLPSGWLVQRLGYPTFFVVACALAVPGLLLLQRIAPLRQSEVTAAPAEPA
ncbi:MAG TPA: MFS transporter [Anaeromyxobacteraceae bacterium]|nr:MFS transporter [Anaeromyxobacteraceae bacterium]